MKVRCNPDSNPSISCDHFFSPRNLTTFVAKMARADLLAVFEGEGMGIPFSVTK